MAPTVNISLSVEYLRYLKFLLRSERSYINIWKEGKKSLHEILPLLQKISLCSKVILKAGEACYQVKIHS